MSRIGDLYRRVAELEKWRREHEVDEAHHGDRLLHSRFFWLVVIIAIIELLSGTGVIAAHVMQWL